MAGSRARPGTDATEAFFDQLRTRGHEPALARAKGVLRFDVADGAKRRRWLVTLDRGDIAVSRANLKADCSIRVDKAVFDCVASGRVNTVAAMLRGTIGAEGDIALFVLFQRLFPAPPSADKR
jgi:ubiquinone biosynthesis protein UbiJ